MKTKLVTVGAFLVVAVAFAAKPGYDDATKYDQLPEVLKGVRMHSFAQDNPPEILSKRRERIKAVAEGELRLVPTFVSCSVVWGSKTVFGDLRLSCRKVGGKWKESEPPVHFQDVGNYRGSILNLSEDTDYEMKLSAHGVELATGKFRTWKSDVPVAKTIVIDPATAKYPIRVNDKGSPDGWIRYTAKPGAVLGHKDLMTGIFTVEDAAYVLLDDMTLVGGGGYYRNNPIFIDKSRAVRVRNCEISGWGRVGTPVYDDASKGQPCTDGKSGCQINEDAGITVYRNVSELVIERCYIHDPRGTSTSWAYAHPCGNEGILVMGPGSETVLRWNDIVGSDFHRFNDCVEGGGNFDADGGFCRDSDIYGNFFIYANDDSIELDGGQQNVRCFWNRGESALHIVSLQGCCTSPVYVYENLMISNGEEYGKRRAAIKDSCFDPWWYAPYAYIAGNYLKDPVFPSWPMLGPTTRWDFRKDNVLTDEPPSREWMTKYPIRDLPFVLDTGMLEDVCLADDGAKVTRTVKAIATKAQPFRVRKNEDAAWFAVTPSEGTLKVGENVFTVTFDGSKMGGRRHWRSAFLVRTPEGLSRVVSVYAKRTDYWLSDRPVPPSDTTLYAKGNGTPNGEYAFDVPKDGEFRFFVQVQADPTQKPKDVPQLWRTAEEIETRVLVSVDGGKEFGCRLFLDREVPVWGRISMDYSVGARPFKAGRHTIRFRYDRDFVPVRVLTVAMSDRVEEFESH